MVRRRVVRRRSLTRAKSTEAPPPPSSIIEIGGAKWDVPPNGLGAGLPERLYPRLLVDDDRNEVPVTATEQQPQMTRRERSTMTAQHEPHMEKPKQRRPEPPRLDKDKKLKGKQGSQRDLLLSRKRPPPPGMSLSGWVVPSHETVDEDSVMSHGEGKPTYRRSDSTLSSRSKSGKPPYYRSDSGFSSRGRPAFPRSDSGFSSISADSRAEEAMGMTLEIFPGYDVKLRGSVETRRAIRRGTITKVSCFDCSMQLGCISDAEYVLCPACKSVSPLLVERDPAGGPAYGVGLGFHFG